MSGLYPGLVCFLNMVMYKRLGNFYGFFIWCLVFFGSLSFSVYIMGGTSLLWCIVFNAFIIFFFSLMLVLVHSSYSDRVSKFVELYCLTTYGRAISPFYRFYFLFPSRLTDVLCVVLGLHLAPFYIVLYFPFFVLGRVVSYVFNFVVEHFCTLNVFVIEGEFRYFFLSENSFGPFW